MASPYVTNLIGRPDLSPGYMQGGGGVSAPSGASSPMLSANGATSASGSVQVGQISLGLMAAGLVGLVVFYLWTKGIQR